MNEKNKKPSHNGEFSFLSIIMVMVGLAFICVGFGVYYDPVVKNEIHNLILAITLACVGATWIFAIVKRSV